MEKKMKNQMTTHEATCFADAVMFTAVRGRGAYRTRENFPTFDDALAYAAEAGDGRTMIYAVTALGGSAHIRNA
jgi:hypothetical protein